MRMRAPAVHHRHQSATPGAYEGGRLCHVSAALEVAECDVRTRIAERIDHADYAPTRDEYWKRLGACDWVLSTARHEFFGIAVVEAMLAGCLPWLPPRLSYPELLSDALRGCSPASPPPDPDAARAAQRKHLATALAGHAVAQIDAHITAVSAP